MKDHNIIVGELLLVICKKINEMNKEIFFSINYIDYNILILLQKKLIDEYTNIGITFQIQEKKTNIYIYKN